MDEFIDELLREERVCDIILPRIQVRFLTYDFTSYNEPTKGLVMSKILHVWYLAHANDFACAITLLRKSLHMQVQLQSKQ